MSFFAGCDFFMVLFILLIPAVLLGLSEKKLKWYRWLLSLFFIWEVYGSTKIQLLYLIGYVIFAAYLVKQNNQTTTSNFPCNSNFAVSNMNRFNQGIDHG